METTTLLNDKITANLTPAELEAVYTAIETKIKAGFATNQFACKLEPNKTFTGKATGLKPYRNWENTSGKGTILTVVAIFNGIEERVNTTDFAVWKSFGVGTPITITTKLNGKGECVASIVATKVEVTEEKTAEKKPKKAK